MTTTRHDAGHAAPLLGTLLDGALPPEQADGVRAHLAACAACAGELELLRAGRSLLPSVGAPEPRPGFAARVAARAGELRPEPLGAPWWRWAFGGGAALAGAAALALWLGPGRPAAPEVAQAGQRPAGVELASNDFPLAQRLDFFEDLAVLQNQEALEDLDVVEELHTLGAQP